MKKKFMAVSAALVVLAFVSFFLFPKTRKMDAGNEEPSSSKINSEGLEGYSESLSSERALSEVRGAADEPSPRALMPDEQHVFADEGGSSEASASPPAMEQGIEEKLTDSLRSVEGLAMIADITSVQCLDGKCRIELEAKGEANIQTPMIQFLASHPEYGTEFRIEDVKDNPRAVIFTFSKEPIK